MDRHHPLWPFFSETTERVDTYYSEPGPWMSAHITTSVPWPSQNQIVFFKGQEFLLLAGTADWTPGVALNLRSNGIESEPAARTAISRLASAIAWRQQAALSIDAFSFDDDSPVHRSRHKLGFVADYLYPSLGDMEQVSDPLALRGLALYREGLSTDNHFYAALNYFKVVENFVEGKNREIWFNTYLPKISIPAITARISIIQKMQSKSVGSYLFESGRNAVAHSKQVDAVDPDDDEARYRFAQDIEIYKAIAKLAINEFVGVKGGQAGLVEPDDQIKGFMELQDSQLLAWLRYRDRPRPDGVQFRVPDPVILVAKKKSEAVALEGVRVARTSVVENGLGMVFAAPDEAGEAGFIFDLKQRKLLSKGVRFAQPDASLPQSRLKAIANLMKFYRLLYTGGVAWILSAEDHKIWGHTNYLVPIYGNYETLLESLKPMTEKLDQLLRETSD